MSYTCAAFVTDAVGSAYIVLMIAWLRQVRVVGDPIVPLQALSRSSGFDVLLIAGGGLMFAAAIGYCCGLVAGIAVGAGCVLACIAFGIGRSLLGPDYRPYVAGTGWSAFLRWLWVIGMFVVGMLGFGVYAGLSELTGGIFSR